MGRAVLGLCQRSTYVPDDHSGKVPKDCQDPLSTEYIIRPNEYMIGRV